MNNEASVLNREERDILIELRTQMIGVRSELADMKSNTMNRLLNLEGNSVSKAELSDVRKDVDFLKRWVWAAIGVLGVVQFVLPLLLK